MLTLALAGLGVGFVVGLTGMGGGALMTPLLVLVLGVAPLPAVSSDLVASLLMKPFGAGVHARRGNVDLALVRWLSFGSVPSAFAGVLVLKTLGGEDASSIIKVLIGVVLLFAAASILGRQVLRRPVDTDGERRFAIRPLPTIAIGALGGFIVGMTSVGSGSLMMVMLALLYPRMSAAHLVGTDLAQAIPLVASAALGHLLFGEVHFGLTAGLLLGAIPGVYLGARFSSRTPDDVIRPVVAVVLAISGARLLGGAAPTVLGTSVVALGLAVVATLFALRRRPRELDPRSTAPREPKER